jgi:hypothetical protein
MTDYRPDSPALRQRRHQAHKRGDHTLCRPEHCESAEGGVRHVELPEPGGVREAVLDFIDRLPVASDAGPQMVMSRAAVALAEAIDTRAPGLAANVRELQTVMGHLGEADDETRLDDLRARRARRRAALTHSDTEEATP